MLVASASPSPLIPRIIHTVWFQVNGGPATPPAEYQAMRASWHRLHPDWQFIDWDLDSSRLFLTRHYPHYLPLFNDYKREIFRIDAIRYFALHHYGGFYVDTDVDCLQSIEGLRSHSVVLALNKYTKNAIHLYNNHFMGSVPRSSFFAACVERLPTAALLQTQAPSYLSVMGTAGPFYLTTIATYHRKKGEIYTLPYQLERSLFIHHERHSWKMTRNILSDVLRVVTVGGIVATGALVAKEVYQRR